MGTTRRPALALARPQAPRIRLRLRRASLLFAATAVVAGLLYLGARETSVFAIRAVEIEGAPEDVARSVRAALAPLVGVSLVSLSEGEVEATLRALPSVSAATIDRDFPDTLRVAVRAERAVAVVRRAGAAWLVGESGTIIRRVELGELPGLARVWLPADVDEPVPGAALIAEEGGAVVRALALLPARFPATVETARGTPDSLTLVLGGKTELRLGADRDPRLKLEAATTVLRSLTRSERAALAYLDVSLPARPVGADKPQVGASA